MLRIFRQNDTIPLIYGVINIPNIGFSFKRITLYLSACLYSFICAVQFQTSVNIMLSCIRTVISGCNFVLNHNWESHHN
jgi:hypothetical protein